MVYIRDVWKMFGISTKFNFVRHLYIYISSFVKRRSSFRRINKNLNREINPSVYSFTKIDLVLN